MCLPCAYLWAWALSCVGLSLIEEINQTTTKSNLELFTTRVIWHLPRKGLLYVQTAWLYPTHSLYPECFNRIHFHGIFLSWEKPISSHIDLYDYIKRDNYDNLISSYDARIGLVLLFCLWWNLQLWGNTHYDHENA